MNFKLGDNLPEFVRKSDFDIWNRYAGVNDEFIPIHMNDDAGRAAGFPAAIGMGNLTWSYFHNLVRSWIGPNGKIERITAQYQHLNLRESTITVRAKIIEISDIAEGSRVTIDLWADDDAGRKLVNGQPTVFLKTT